MTNRRGFLSLLSTLAATAVLDPELSLWVPGKKTISIPKQNERLYRTVDHDWVRFSSASFASGDLGIGFCYTIAYAINTEGELLKKYGRIPKDAELLTAKLV